MQAWGQTSAMHETDARNRASRPRRRFWRGVAFVVLMLALAVIGYAWRVAPYSIEVSRHRVPMRVKEKLTVLQVSDLHAREFGRRELELLRVMNEVRPDVIVVTGDSVTAGTECRVAAQTLDQLNAPLGVYMVPGNWEYWMAAQQGSECVCPSKAVRCLHNEALELRDGLWLVGVDDALTGSADLPKAFERVPPEAEVLVLAHEPVVLDELARGGESARGGLVLAGHTHGGQICLPLLGPIVRPPGSGPYVSGWYTHANARLYVSRGIGNSVIDARLVCGPEIPVFEIVPRLPGSPTPKR